MMEPNILHWTLQKKGFYLSPSLASELASNVSKPVILCSHVKCLKINDYLN